MRFEPIIATVTRNLVIAMVREVVVAREFVNALHLYLWLRRVPMVSMPSSITWADLAHAKRDGAAYQPSLVPASCPTRSARG